MPESQQPSRNNSGSWRGNYSEWIAVGALIAGSVGALYGAKHCSRRAHRTGNEDRPESTKLTAPHGDKLEAALR